mgnify:CR=1 FL=1
MTRENGTIDASILRPAAPEPVDGDVTDVQRGATTRDGR